MMSIRRERLTAFALGLVLLLSVVETTSSAYGDDSVDAGTNNSDSGVILVGEELERRRKVPLSEPEDVGLAHTNVLANFQRRIESSMPETLQELQAVISDEMGHSLCDHDDEVCRSHLSDEVRKGQRSLESYEFLQHLFTGVEDQNAAALLGHSHDDDLFDDTTASFFARHVAPALPTDFDTESKEAIEAVLNILSELSDDDHDDSADTDSADHQRLASSNSSNNDNDNRLNHQVVLRKLNGEFDKLKRSTTVHSELHRRIAMATISVGMESTKHWVEAVHDEENVLTQRYEKQFACDDSSDGGFIANILDSVFGIFGREAEAEAEAESEAESEEQIDTEETAAVVDDDGFDGNRRRLLSTIQKESPNKMHAKTKTGRTLTTPLKVLGAVKNRSLKSTKSEYYYQTHSHNMGYNQNYHYHSNNNNNNNNDNRRDDDDDDDDDDRKRGNDDDDDRRRDDDWRFDDDKRNDNTNDNTNDNDPPTGPTPSTPRPTVPPGTPTRSPVITPRPTVPPGTPTRKPVTRPPSDEPRPPTPAPTACVEAPPTRGLTSMIITVIAADVIGAVVGGVQIAATVVLDTAELGTLVYFSAASKAIIGSILAFFGVFLANILLD